MVLLDLFITSSIPVLKVLLVTALGTYLALDRVNVLGEDARKHINNIVFYVFNPAFVASKLAETVTYDTLVKMWFMPFNIFITFLLGSVFGWIVVQFTRPPSHLQSLVLGCCAAGNLGNLFLIMVPAVCKEKGSPFGSPDVRETIGLAYVSLAMAIGAIFLWSYVFNIMRASSAISMINESSKEAFTPELGSCREPLLLSKEILASEDHLDQYAPPNTGSDGRVERLGKLVGNINWKSLFAPSTIGAIVGFIAGLIPLIQKLIVGDNAPLRVIQDSACLLGYPMFLLLLNLISTLACGDGAIPALTIILGANLLKGLTGSGVQKSIIVGIVVVRYIALPLIGIFIVKGALHFGLIPHDPLYEFILLLQFAAPPAMNIGTISQLFGTGESECSVIMLWSYILASFALTLWSTFFMWLVA